ncbi:hypothetical protein G6F59_013913 [Rhizopus arrhizus]|nr:hypothetical protein G6F59_013913 [Rhizopus arrhizus]
MPGRPQSSLAAAADIHLDVSVPAEACPLDLAPTSSTTASLAMGDALAVALLDARGFTADDFARSHPAGSLGRRLLLHITDVMHTGDDLPTGGAGASLSEALMEMSRKRLGMTAVVDADGVLIGLFTDGDLRRALAARGALVDVLRAQIAAEPDKDELKLALAMALLQIGGVDEAGTLIDGLPANLATDDRAVRARARLSFAAALKDAPAAEVLDARIATDGNDLKARHLRGVQLLLGGHDEAALAQFLEMLRIDRSFEEGLPRKALIDAFNVISDEDLVGQYRRRMASLLF